MIPLKGAFVGAFAKTNLRSISTDITITCSERFGERLVSSHRYKIVAPVRQREGASGGDTCKVRAGMAEAVVVPGRNFCWGWWRLDLLNGAIDNLLINPIMVSTRGV